AVGGVQFVCTTTGIERVCAAAQTYAPARSRALSIPLVIPAGVAPGSYPIGVRTRGNAAIGGSFDSSFERIAFVPVGALATQAPAPACPIREDAASIAGTSEPDAAIELRFDGQPRATALADAAGTWSTAAPGGALYAGLEVTATAEVAGKLASAASAPCTVDAVRPDALFRSGFEAPD
ncbi:MAG TPA: hypothetical protein VFO79_08575, partial [Xanthomonadales bacterium]|nr:hypothetical protein [Xanthomonadales bacterium]